MYDSFNMNIKPNSIQSVIFNKDDWTIKDSKKWLKDHHLNPSFKKPHITKNFIRFRQQEPIEGSRYRTLKLNNGIEFILMYS